MSLKLHFYSNQWFSAFHFELFRFNSIKLLRWRTDKVSTYKYWSGSVLKNQIDKCEKTLSENIVNLNFQCLGLPSGWSCRKAWQNIFLANLPFPKTFSNSALVDWQNIFPVKWSFLNIFSNWLTSCAQPKIKEMIFLLT